MTGGRILGPWVELPVGRDALGHEILTASRVVSHLLMSVARSIIVEDFRPFNRLRRGIVFDSGAILYPGTLLGNVGRDKFYY